MWIATKTKGISKLYDTYQRFSIIRQIPGSLKGLNSNNVYAIQSDSNNILWVGTSEGGLNKIDMKSRESVFYMYDPNNENSITSNNIYDIFTKPETDDLWIATVGGGLVKFNKITEEIKSYKHDSTDPTTISSNYLTAITPDRNGNLWIGTLGLGLDHLNIKTGQITKYKSEQGNDNSLSDNTIFTLETDKDWGLWIGTNRAGLSYLNPETGNFTQFIHNPNDSNSIIDNSVNALFYDKKGFIWVGTSNGLSKLEISTGEFTNYDLSDQIPNNTIYGVLMDDKGIVWLSTGNGIAKMDPEIGGIVHFTKNDGLQGNQFNLFASHKGLNGELYFGGPNGLNIVHPEEIVIDDSEINATLVDFKLFNNNVPIGSDLLPFSINETENIVLNYDQNVITIKFSGLNYKITSKHLFQTRLVGFTNNWSTASHDTSATYTNLDPGDYIFQVRAANHDGVWNKEITQLYIKILAPWWETTWFRITLITILINAIILVIVFRERNIRNQNKILENKVKERTREYQVANNNLTTTLIEVNLLKDKMQRLAIRDSLTNLYNRRFLIEHMEKELSKAKRNGQKVGILMLDIDDFKIINDTYGHDCGDYSLVELAKLLNKCTRDEDYIFRFGGEEFVIVISNINSTDLELLCTKIVNLVAKMQLKYQGKLFSMTISLGGAVYPEHGTDQDNLLRHADSSLYKVKESGKNNYIIKT